MLHRQVLYHISCDYPGCCNRNSEPERFSHRDECERRAFELGWIRGARNAWYCPQCAARLYSQTIAAVPEDASEPHDTSDSW